ncbi:hypothetical protein ACQR0V_24025 [Bradyrhizobium sp. HKCCYLS2058]|uniref:hypothetical protein n=1 Tax=Bradyrhizobium TaxID=374 RepID=UPI0028F07AAC|nr:MULTISPECIES: hypothetical protein [unclassified Bradyrhizobium]
MRTSTAFFAGAGTVAIAVAAGLGGGLMIAEGMHPRSPALEQAKLERSVPEAPSPSPTVTSYLAATQAAAITPVKVAPAATETRPVTPVSTDPSPAPQDAAAEATAASSANAVTQTATAEDVQDKAAAKPEDADLKSRGAERKRAAEQRRAERHRQYVERRRQRREQDMRAVEQAVRDDTTPRAYAAQPVGMDGPRFSFFGDD